MDAMFTGEEAFGKFLDLNEPYALFISLKGITPISYMAYLDEFDRFVKIAPETKASVAYKQYANRIVLVFFFVLGRVGLGVWVKRGWRAWGPHSMRIGGSPLPATPCGTALSCAVCVCVCACAHVRSSVFVTPATWRCSTRT